MIEIGLLFRLGSDWFTGVKLSPAGILNVAYFHQKTNSPLQLGVELETSLAVKESSATFSYQYDLNKANTTFRGNQIVLRSRDDRSIHDGVFSS